MTTRPGAAYFKFAFDPQSVGPAGLVVSPPLSAARTRRRPLPSSCIRTGARGSRTTTSIRSTEGSAVDFVGRFESLEEDLKRALDQIGLKLDKTLPRAKTTFRRISAPYRDYYDGDTRAIVGDWYEREIKLLDYAF
jgi:hypothetical protein